MGRLWVDQPEQHSDTLHTRDGEVVTVRLVGPDDAEELQHYFRSLSALSRYNRFFGAIGELPPSLLDQFVRVGDNGRFTVVASMMIEGFETVVGEARYAFHADTSNFEFGLSIDDRWQGHGIGAALLKNLECRAAALGAERMFGDTLRSNEAMMSLARGRGFSFTGHPDDWKLVRFEKQIDFQPSEIPCASWRLAAEARALSGAVS
ncbi:MAG: GNAT family N-acetyltransferase [Bradyrhizobium sp.]|uniref:GNAT family N-acetyltransferase n=1 Tax=Bradyrhizobium sp. TaxID=376 RepID=UPI0025C2101E|nr:GNAT family N-acetyltransferase [Bradyrhizobium sp.]MBI5263466.1 GNAT family N-acetyltransferase [Bradyrhizobium sp.]